MDSESLYRRLQQHLDRMPVGFPATQSGVEIRILKYLFTPEEAEIALALSAIPEPAAATHKRVKSGTSIEDLTRDLDRMFAKGAIQRVKNHGVPHYGKLPFALGIYERQVNRLTPEFERDARQYMLEAFSDAFHSTKTTQMRVVPVNQTVAVERSVATYDDIRNYVRSVEGPFARLNCICRQGRDLVGEKCKQTDTRDNCLMIGMAATFTVENSGARFISREEMLEMLDLADRDGLVLQPENTQRPLFICCCCNCCCGVLTMARRFPRPADYFSSNFYAKVDEEACQNCGTCETRCQLDAIHTNAKTEVDLARCIGCGLCVSTCPSDAMHLAPKEAQKTPPGETKDLYLKLLQDRFGPSGMARLGLRKALGMQI